MRTLGFLTLLAISATVGIPGPVLAQTSTPPTIHNVTLNEGAGVLTITGTGFGLEPQVTIAGQRATVLSSGTETQIEVLAPAVLLTTPGSYRLTLVDAARQVGDTFVVASQAEAVVLGSTQSAIHVPFAGAVPAAVGLSATAAIAGQSVNGPGRQVIEDSGSPNRTAIGHQALFSNTTGIGNTASGYRALFSNTTASENTASGYVALALNTTGADNTATGSFALGLNGTGSYNTASGWAALYSNTGSYNTASGWAALYSNTGSYNTASGSDALRANTTADANTASGYQALFSNTTGSFNTASGYRALYFNTTGQRNVALGYAAGELATTGSYNLFLGAEVRGTSADANTTRIGLPYIDGVGQNRTFIAGIYGTQLTGPAVQVFIDANGQLGTLTAGVQSGTIDVPVGQLEQQMRDQERRSKDQEAVIADLRARLARLEALLGSAAGN